MIQRPAGPYGRQRLSRSSRRWIVVGLTVLVLAIGIGIAVVASQRLGTGEVKGELGGYHLVDDETVQVTITVTRDDPSRPVVCIVRARSLDGSETGRREVLVPPSTKKTVQVTTVVVGRPPVVGDVYGCGTDAPCPPLWPPRTHRGSLQQTANSQFVKIRCPAVLDRYTVLLTVYCAFSARIRR
jgi:hypothetical protein